MIDDKIAVFFLVISFVNHWPAHDREPAHTNGGGMVESVYLSKEACLRRARHFVISPAQTSVGVVRATNVKTRCQESEASLKW